MTSTSLKVQKSKLIERIRESRLDAEEKHIEEQAAVQAKYDKWLVDAQKSLDKLAARAIAGKVNLDTETWNDFRSRSDGYVTVIEVHSKACPEKPKPRKFDGSEWDSDLRLLELAEADTVVVTTNNQWSRYL